MADGERSTFVERLSTAALAVGVVLTVVFAVVGSEPVNELSVSVAAMTLGTAVARMVYESRTHVAEESDGGNDASPRWRSREFWSSTEGRSVIRLIPAVVALIGLIVYALLA